MREILSGAPQDYFRFLIRITLVLIFPLIVRIAYYIFLLVTKNDSETFENDFLAIGEILWYGILLFSLIV